MGGGGLVVRFNNSENMRSETVGGNIKRKNAIKNAEKKGFFGFA